MLSLPGLTALQATVLRIKNCQERNFDRKGFMDIAAEMIAQFFDTPNAF